MTTSTELRRIVGAMTERPWRVERDLDYVSVGPFDLKDNNEGPEHDYIAIATLANHADAIVALVEACERESAVLSAFAARNGAAYANTAKAIENVLSALAAVHAVKP